MGIFSQIIRLLDHYPNPLLMKKKIKIAAKAQPGYQIVLKSNKLFFLRLVTESTPCANTFTNFEIRFLPGKPGKPALHKQWGLSGPRGSYLNTPPKALDGVPCLQGLATTCLEGETLKT